MTLSTLTNRATFTGNSSTTVFSFPYYFLVDADLVVVSRNTTTGVETVKTLTTHYTITGAGVAAGGSVTMLTAPATGTKLIIYRNPSLTQALDMQENDALPVETVEASLDKLTMFVQRLSERLDRAIVKADAFTPTFDLTLPVDLDTAGDKVPLVNAAGTAWAAVSAWPTADDIENAEEEADAAAASAAAAAASAASAALDVLSVTGTSAAPTLLVAGTALTVAANYNHKKYIAGSGGAVDVSANPQIAAGSRDGQWLLLVGCHDTNTVKYENGTGLDLEGQITMGLNWQLWLSWDATAAVWVEVCRSER